MVLRMAFVRGSHSPMFSPFRRASISSLRICTSAAMASSRRCFMMSTGLESGNSCRAASASSPRLRMAGCGLGIVRLSREAKILFRTAYRLVAGEQNRSTHQQPADQRANRCRQRESPDRHEEVGDDEQHERYDRSQEIDAKHMYGAPGQI